MRLHSLHLQAFGPFARRHTINFDALSADGLFLLHDDTAPARAPCSAPSTRPLRLPPTNATYGCAAITLPRICSPEVILK